MGEQPASLGHAKIAGVNIRWISPDGTIYGELTLPTPALPDGHVVGHPDLATAARVLGAAMMFVGMQDEKGGSQ